MTSLRQQMIDAMRRRGFSERTHCGYLRAVRDLARFQGRCPAELGVPELEQYFRHLAVERGLSGASCRVHRNAIRFLYLKVLRWPAFDVPFVVPKRPAKSSARLRPAAMTAGNPVRQSAQWLRVDVRPEIKTVFFSSDLSDL